MGGPGTDFGKEMVTQNGDRLGYKMSTKKSFFQLIIRFFEHVMN